MSIHSQTALTCACLCKTGQSRTPRFLRGLRRLARAATPVPRPPTPHTLPGTACSTDTKNPEAHSLSLHSRQPWEAGTAGSAGGAEEGAEEAAPLVRNALAFADPELDRRRATAAEAPTRTPPLKPNRSHLYAQHRCRRRSRRGPPYPPLPRTSAAASAGGGSATVFTARNP